MGPAYSVVARAASTFYDLRVYIFCATLGLVPNPVEELRAQVAREAFARRVAAGESLEMASASVGLSLEEAHELVAQPEIFELIEELSPAVAAALKADPVKEGPTDPLAILDEVSGVAAETLRKHASTPTGARIVLELAAKMRAAAAEAPAHVTVQIDKTRLTPLISALNDLSVLLGVLIEEDKRARESA